jgi:hypothetical protein
MFIRSFKEISNYVRSSKLGKEHHYTRTKTINVFRCDNCDRDFTRDHAKIDPKRLSNKYFHVCGECDVKKFAQRMGITKRKIWDMPVSSTLPIGKI